MNLAKTVAFGIEYMVRDMAKSAWVLARVLERSQVDVVYTDVPLLETSIPSYPYLASVGSILESEAGSLGISIRNISVGSHRLQSRWKSLVGAVYSFLEAPRAIARLSEEHPLLVIGPHRGFYLPVARCWQGCGSSSIVGTPKGRPVRASHKEGLYLLPFERLVGRRDRAEVEAFQTQLMEALSTLEFQEPIVQHGLDLSPILRAYLQKLFQLELPVLTAIGLGFDRSLANASHVLLVEMGSAIAKACALYARQKSIPVTVLQHGVVPARMSYMEGVDFVAAWGTADGAWYRRSLGRNVKVEPTGCPRYDFLAATPLRLSEPPLPPDRQVVLFASQSFFQDEAMRSRWDQEAVLRMVMQGARHPDWILAIKWHPSELPSMASGEGEGVVKQFHKENTMALVRRSDAVMTLFSTVALEAMYLSRPVVFLGPRDVRTPFDPPSSGAGLRVTEAAELRETIRRLLNESQFRQDVVEDQQRYLERNYAPLDGRAGERVVAFLKRTKA